MERKEKKVKEERTNNQGEVHLSPFCKEDKRQKIEELTCTLEEHIHWITED